MFRNKTIIITMVLIFIFSSVGFSAVSFIDVSDNFWAKTYINHVASDNIMEGYDDGYFYPNRKVSKLEALLSLYRVMNKNDLTNISDVTALVNEYKDTIERLSIPPMLAPYGDKDLYPAVAYALDQGIITESELKYFVEEGELSTATKIEVSVYYGKALNLIKNEDLFDEIISLEYKDQFEITNAAIAYVDLLIKNNIVSAKGDSQGKFNPNQEMTRGVLAVFATNLDKALGNSGNEVLDESDNGRRVNGSGEISYINTNMNVIEIKSANGDLQVFNIENLDVYINGNSSTLSNLEAGQSISYVVKGKDIIEISYEESFDTFTGNVITVSKLFERNGEKYRVLGVKGLDGTNNYYKVLAGIEVESNGSLLSVTDLDEDERIKVEFDGLYAKRLEKVSENEILTGILLRPIGEDKIVRVKLSNGDVFIGEGKNIDDDIQRDEIVKLHLTYGEIVKVESTGESSSVSGTIKEIVISKNPTIKLLSTEGNLVEYALSDLSKMTDAESDEEIDIYDLRLDQYSEIQVNGISITSLIITKPIELTKFSGTVVSVYNSLNIVEVENTSGEIITLGFNASSNYMAKDLKIGDELLISGLQLNDEIFEAKSIIITN